MAIYLHIAEPNKFTLPFCEYINYCLKRDNHIFLFTSDSFEQEKFTGKKVYCFLQRFRNHFLSNTILFYKLCKKADIIYMHGAQFTTLFIFFPLFIKKLAWVINGSDLYCMINKPRLKSLDPNRLVLKHAHTYVTHIKGDADLANRVLNNNAKFHYATLYMSNTISTDNFSPKKIVNKARILVGNSNSKNNNHLHIFEKLKAFENEIEYILCPLSYGDDLEYKITVKETGSAMFGQKFRTLETFLSPDQYNEVLSEIDIAVFNHWRQEALGATLSLLSLGKIVYVNPKTTSYKSLTERGFQIFDNNLLFSMGPIVNRDVIRNKELIEQYYSKKVLLETLELI